MKMMLTNRNQFTIPKDIVKKLKLELGKYYDLEVANDRLIFHIDKSYDNATTINTESISDISKNTDDNNFVKSSKSDIEVNGIKIESNLKEGQNFYRKIYSPCKLVIRTKKTYIDKFCNACKGKLLEYHEGDCDCIYKKSEPILKDENFKKLEDTVIEPVSQEDYVACSKCEEYHNTGFFIDNNFYCKSCAIKDFKEYFKNRKECDR